MTYRTMRDLFPDFNDPKYWERMNRELSKLPGAGSLPPIIHTFGSCEPNPIMDEEFVNTAIPASPAFGWGYREKAKLEETPEAKAMKAEIDKAREASAKKFSDMLLKAAKMGNPHAVRIIHGSATEMDWPSISTRQTGPHTFEMTLEFGNGPGLLHIDNEDD